MKKIREDKGFFRVKSAGNDVLCVLSGESDAVLQLKVRLEQKLLVVYVNDNAPA